MSKLLGKTDFAEFQISNMNLIILLKNSKDKKFLILENGIPVYTRELQGKIIDELYKANNLFKDLIDTDSDISIMFYLQQAESGLNYKNRMTFELPIFLCRDSERGFTQFDMVNFFKVNKVRISLMGYGDEGKENKMPSFYERVFVECDLFPDSLKDFILDYVFSHVDTKMLSEIINVEIVKAGNNYWIKGNGIAKLFTKLADLKLSYNDIELEFAEYLDETEDVN